MSCLGGFNSSDYIQLHSNHPYELHNHSLGTMSKVKTESKIITLSNKKTLDTQVSKVQVGGVYLSGLFLWNTIHSWGQTWQHCWGLKNSSEGWNVNECETECKPRFKEQTLRQECSRWQWGGGSLPPLLSYESKCGPVWRESCFNN